MKKNTLFFCFLVFICFTGYSQVSIGESDDGGVANSSPINLRYGYSYSQVIYLASEINASGSITSIGFQLNPGSEIVNSDENVDVWIGHTDKVGFESNSDWVDINTLTQVLTNGTITAANDVLTITFENSFDYNGQDNLIIAIDANESGWDSSTSYLLQTNIEADENLSINYRSDNTNPDPLNPSVANYIQTLRGNIILNGITQVCLKPTDITINNVTSDSAEISWTAGEDETEWEILYGEEGFDPEIEGISISDNDGVLGETLEGLSPNTEYEFYVKAICGVDEESSRRGPSAFLTACESITDFPYIEDFESVITPNLSSCWSALNANNDSDFWKTYVDYGIDDSRAVGIYTDYNSGDNDDYLISPLLTLTGNERLRFSMRARSLLEPNEFEVLLSTGGKNANEFTEELLPVTEISNTSYEDYTINLDQYIGDVYISFHIPPGNIDGYYIYMDNFVVEEIPSCQEPSDVTINNITSDSAEISWTAGEDETEWEILYGEEGFDPETEGIMVADDDGVLGVSISGLSESTFYDVYVRAVCGEDEESIWTLGSFFTFPLNDECDNAIEITINDNLECNTTTLGSTVGATASDLGENEEDVIGTPNNDVWFRFVATSASHPISLSNVQAITGTSVDMAMALYNGDQGCESLELVADSDPNSFTAVGLTVGDTYYLRVYGYSSTSSTAQARFDVCVQTIQCPEPMEVTIENITTSSAEVNWVAGGSETEWEIIFGEVDFDPETEGELITDSDGNIGEVISNLSTDTNYEVYLRSICGEDSESELVGPISFATLIEPVIVSSENPILNETYCYTNNELKRWLFKAENEEVLRISFSSGTLEEYLSWFGIYLTYDDLVIYDGQDETGDVLFNSDGDGYELEGLTFDAFSGYIYMTLTSDGSTSCNSGSEETIDFDINILSCPKPTEVTIANITNNSVEVSWTSNGSETEWDILYGEEGFDPETEGTSIIDNDEALGEIIENLDANTEYELYVRASCGDGDISEWSESVTFITDCEVVIPNYINEFTEEPSCWTEVGAGDPENGPDAEAFGSGNWFLEEFLNEEETTNMAMAINLYTDNREDWLISPSFDLSQGQYELKFTTAITEYDSPSPSDMGSDDEVQVLISQDNGETWQMLITYDQSNSPSATGDIETIDLSAYSGTVKFAFWATDGEINDDEDYEFFIDDFEVNTLPCETPTDLEITNITATTAEVSWTSNGDETEWEVLYGEADFDPETEGTSFLDDNGELGITLSDLIPETTYDVYVRAICSTDDTSDWTTAESFSTLQEPCETPTDLEITNITATTAEVSWTSNGDETEWEILYGEADFDPETEGTSLLDNDGVLGITITDLTPETTYDVYVRAICGTDDTSDWTALESFIAEPLGVDSENFIGFNYYPNPVKSLLHLQAKTFSIEEVIVYDLLGKQIVIEQFNNLNATVNLEKLNTGSYVVVVKIGNQSKIIRLVKE
ncbi:fibronectin type III domain-containing protein [Mesonia aestuariivivens]|uniref:Fibronectin type III domain-containing protein n=1 Tax=Mesonia aestuariivivens TaxID=2796128 RepID=A0ABS6W020_9FLAO|nr:fibronectin type III domain-containing protein [Mesonia aestuariivivens]MBW2961185.1 fibronectin type III domain-containing protein [Mesonia aestuariivivens]